MPAPTAPVQREAVRRTFVAVGAVLPVDGLALRSRLRPAAGHESRQALDVAAFFAVRLLARRIGLRLLLESLLAALIAAARFALLVRLRLLALLEGLLLLRLLLLRLLRCIGLAGESVGRIVVTVVVAAVALVAEERRGLPELLLHRGDQPEVMLGVLIVVLGCDRIAGRLRIPRKLHVFVGDMRGSAANLHVRTIGFVNSR